MGVASTVPAYSLNPTVAILIGAVGLCSPSAMDLAFLPMLGVAVGFYWLNRSIPNCDTSYAWISRAMNPALGFFTGWVIVVADVIVMISDVLTCMAQTLAGNNKIWYLMVLAVVSSAAPSTLTTILPTAHVARSLITVTQRETDLAAVMWDRAPSHHDSVRARTSRYTTPSFSRCIGSVEASARTAESSVSEFTCIVLSS